MNDKGRAKGGVSCGGNGHFFGAKSKGCGFPLITRRVELWLRYAVAIHSSGFLAINIVAALQLWNQRFGIKGSGFKDF